MPNDFVHAQQNYISAHRGGGTSMPKLTWHSRAAASRIRARATQPIRGRRHRRRRSRRGAAMHRCVQASPGRSAKVPASKAALCPVPPIRSVALMESIARFPRADMDSAPRSLLHSLVRESLRACSTSTAWRSCRPSHGRDGLLLGGLHREDRRSGFTRRSS